MPNHVTTYLRASQIVLDKLRGPNAEVDFNQIIPQPDNIERGGCSGEHKPGVVCWYNWNIDNWGTKWGAYSIETDAPMPEIGIGGVAPLMLVEPRIVRFDTAWSYPEPVIVALSKMFPDERIEVAYADEDLGGNYGVLAYLDGAVIEGQDEPFGQFTDTARNFACMLKYGQSYASFFGEDDE